MRPSSASGSRAAISTARSVLSQSSRKKPASSSLASANGPSLMSVRPSRTETRLVSDRSARASVTISSPDAASSSARAL